jgi:hypothetical protein
VIAGPSECVGDWFNVGGALSHPAVDYEKAPQFLVDLNVFRGSSGSPVFLDFSGLRVSRSLEIGKRFQETPSLLLRVLRGADNTQRITEETAARVQSDIQ